MGFDRTMVEQFAQYMANAARLDFGTSYLQHRPAMAAFSAAGSGTCARWIA